MNRYRPAFILLAICFVTGCRRDEIQTYKVPKELPSGMTGEINPPTPAKLTWTSPKGWKEQPASSMRMGSFLVPGENGQQADVSIVALSGEAGSNLANINRWRGQINLVPLSQADLTAQSETITTNNRKMLYVNFVSTEKLIENRYKKRLIAAIYRQPEQTLFFKMMGEDATVLSAKPSFIKLLRSLKFEDHETKPH